MIEKRELRREMTAKRDDIHGKVDASTALENLREAIAQRPGPVSFYWPIRSEIDPRPVMESLSLTQDVCLPVTVGHAPLLFRPWQPGMELETDAFGVSVPATTEEVKPNTLVVPMLAFSDAGHRLGYGAGHYDRTLAELRPAGHITAIGFAYEGQRLESLPTEDTDQPLDVIVTEATIRHFAR